MTDITQSTIKEIGRQVREQHEARTRWERGSYPRTLEQILGDELKRRAFAYSHAAGAPSMTDLITRLRGPVPSILAMRDAADEIERLKIDLRDYMLAANAEATEVNQCYERLAASQERAKALEDALRPFARFGIVKSAMRNQPKTGEMYAVHTILGRSEITVEDFSHAAALLGES